MDEKAFLRSVAEQLRCDEKRAEGVTFAVFQELRDRITASEAADAASQMPAGLRNIWNSMERPGRQVRKTHQQEFIGEVRKIAGLSDEVEAQRAIKVVFKALQTLLGSSTGQEGEAWDIYSQLPKDLKHLWREASNLARE